ncbi:unnamed protein product [Ranitomeya imitator]|uniref:BRK domain-containing protein n=1 Tax=Ranitomeya imitator TaxID=111125 RepID=A0ABN9LA87_9NEOB|nr:unnamed protein product [Ranitomeya imitator]
MFHRDKVVLRPSPTFLLKVVSSFHLIEDIVLPSLCPTPTHRVKKALHSLDLVRALRKYVSRTASFRQTDALFVLPAGHRKGLAASKSTIARWIRSTIQEAYRVRGKPIPAGLKAHSARSVGASWAIRNQASAEQDRVIINRLDSICQVVLKGKWPATRKNYDGTSVASFYTTKLLDSPGAATEYSDPGAQPPTCAPIKEESNQSQQMSKEGGLKLTFQKQGIPQKRPLDSEEGMGQQQYLARLQDLQNASEASLVTFPKSTPASGSHNMVPSSNVNGMGTDAQPVIKRRRGRRKNVEGVDILYMNRNKLLNHVKQAVTPSPSQPASRPQLPSGPQLPGALDADSPVPVINLKDGTRLAGDDAPKRRDLESWLKAHPGYVEDLGAFIPRMQLHDGRPKQKRHRCRNPTKLDVNSLTGEERVQLINKRNARKVGGAFAPPMKDLCRFLKENPEYGVAPEWGDVVKQS